MFYFYYNSLLVLVSFVLFGVLNLNFIWKETIFVVLLAIWNGTAGRLICGIK